MEGIEKVLVGYDDSAEARRALSYAIWLSKLTDASLGIVSVVPVHDAHPKRMSGVEPWDDDSVHETELAAAQASAREAGLDPELYRPHGNPAEKIAEVAEEHSYSHIVVGHRHLGQAGKLFTKSVSKRVASEAEITVTIVK